MVTKSTASTASNTASASEAQANTDAATDTSTVSQPTKRESGPAPRGTARALDPDARPRSFREAFLLMAPERAALTKSELVTPGPLDVAFAVSTTLSAVTRLDQKRDQIAARFPQELGEIDKLDTLARATAHAATLVNTTLAPAPKLQSVYEAALVARRLLISDMNNLIVQSLLSPQAADRLTNDAGHNNVANDILAIVQFLTQGGPEVLDTMATPLDKLTEYEQLAYELVELSSRRVPQAVTTEQARDELLRSLTLLLRAYATAERVMAFFDLKDNAYRKIVPSLYSNKSKGRKAPSEEEADAPTEPADPITSGIEDVITDDANITAPEVAGARGGSPFATRTTKS